jgi:hypothetical protein
LNFAFEEEAENFLHCAKTTVASRNRRREGKQIAFVTTRPFEDDDGSVALFWRKKVKK